MSPAARLNALLKLKQPCDRAGLKEMQLRLREGGQRLWEIVVACSAKPDFPWLKLDLKILDALALLKPVGVYILLSRHIPLILFQWAYAFKILSCDPPYLPPPFHFCVFFLVYSFFLAIPHMG